MSSVISICVLLSFLVFFLMLPPPPTSTLFPYTTLFRSRSAALARASKWKPLGGLLSREKELAQALRPPPPIIFRRKIIDRKSTRLNSSHTVISYAVFCLKKKKKKNKNDYSAYHTDHNTI